MVSGIGSSTALTQLFSKLDTKNQGYLEKSDLASAFSKISSSDQSSSVDELFSTLDGDGDGKVTSSEFSSTLSQLQSELDSQYNSMRMQGYSSAHGGHGGGMPPPPPESDSGFTQDELQSQLDEIGSTDSQRSDFITNIVNNFEAADTDSDGKVTFSEAQAYNSSSDTTTTSSSTATGHAHRPPPGAESDQGFSLSELQSQLEEIGSTDSQRAAFINNIANNFEAADSDGNGKVTLSEAQAYNKTTEESTRTASSTTEASASQRNDEAQLLKRIMQLMHAYSSFNDNNTNTSSSSQLSVSA